MRRHALIAVSACAALFAGCADADPAAPAGSRIAIEAAPLNLVGVAEAQWTVAVHACALTDGACAPQVAGDPVFEVTLTSTRYGDGRGAASYVGPCDASTFDNRVTVTLDWLEDADGERLAFQSPGPLSRWVPCEQNRDTFVQFDVAVLRPARQGFFDIAVDFGDVFCSAKYDCAAGDLLFNGPTRDRTHVFGFACTGATGEGAVTELYLDDLEITCPGPVSATLALPPAGQSDGNQGPVVVGDATWLFQWAVFSGEEQLPGLNKRYYNIALGLGAGLPAGCSLTTRGTVDSTARPALDDRALPAGVVYPVITWQIPDLTACAGNHALNESPNVQTGYTTTSGAGTSFDHALFNPGAEPPPPAPTPPPIYANAFSVANQNQLYRFEPGPPAALPLVVNITGLANNDALTDIALAADGTLYGITFNALYTLDPMTGAATFRCNLPGSANALAVTGPGDLVAVFALSPPPAPRTLRSIDPTTCATALLADLPAYSHGDVVAATNRILYYVTPNDDFGSSVLWRIDLGDSSVTIVGELSPARPTMGLAFAGGVLYGFDGDLSGDGNAYTIDTTDASTAWVTTAIGAQFFGAASAPP